MAIADPDQQAVIDIDKGRHLVLAPPGCGKTFILAERVIRAHAHGVEYGDMMCLTFTNRASRAMRERISERTHNPVPSDLFVGNVHRFCSNYLFGQQKVPKNSAVIDDLDSESIICNLARLDPREDHSRFASNIVDLQHALSQRQSGMPKELIVHADKLDEADAPNAQRKVEVANLYAKSKEEDCLLDFEDLLEKTYLYASQDEDRHRYKWIQVDEVQDLNPLQMAIIDLVSKGECILYLGDEQQAIFSFMGAKLSTLDMLRERCTPVSDSEKSLKGIHHLAQNHRSPRYLLDIYNRYAEKVLGIDPAILPQPTNDDKAESATRFIYANTVNDEIEKITQQAGEWLSTNPEETTAIVTLSNADAEDISSQLNQLSLPLF